MVAPEKHYTVDEFWHIFGDCGDQSILDGGDVLPGFTLPVREVFKKLQD